MITRYFFLFVFIGVSPITFAHDLWFELSSYDPEPSQKISVNLLSGHAFHGESIPRRSTDLPEFVISDAIGIRQIPGLSGQKPAGIYTAPSGPHVLGFISQPRNITLTPEKFNQHLREIGGAIEKQPTNPVVEKYTKFVKAFVGGSGSEKLAPLGHPLEFVELSDPFAGDTRSALSGLLLQDKKPVSDVLIRAFCDDGTTADTTTNSEGRFSIPLHEAGRWVLVAVTIRPGSLPNHYESLWASLTFSLPPGKQTSENP